VWEKVMSAIEALETSFEVRHAFDLSKVAAIRCGPRGGVTLKFAGGADLDLEELKIDDYDQLVARWKALR
jgi:hypothetical protein